MAKKKKTEYVEMEEEKGYSVFQWILFVLVIPLLFAITIALIVMTVAGVNIFEKAKELGGNLPVISDMMDSGSSAKDGQTDKEKVVSLQAEIKNKEAKVEQLEKKLESSDKEIEELLTEKDRLEVEIEKLKKQEETTVTEDKQDNKLINTYESMSSKNIANILVNLTDNEAVQILSEMSTEKQADILEKLPPETAAKYTKLLSSAS
ncbi:MotE family protein [Bacillus aerolatus]|uniref:MotE family protein n=1 Tax=Bacillus aerolatus TaxID=2653354 RepID=UPI0017808C55|nr:MotE family protein [Bacillus aerolatus]